MPVLAFHGFGRTGADFHVFEAALGDFATIHAFDLPFHGDSPSPSERAGQPFTPAELRDHFTAFLDHIGAEKAMLIGYSLGGRVALSLLETMPERIARAVLIAPDGLKPRPWYRRLADSPWGRARYRRFIEHPERVHFIINTLHRLGLLRDKLHRFIIGQTDSIHKRRLLHDVWLSFRHIEVDLPVLADRLRTWLMARAPEHPLFLCLLAELALQVGPPLGWAGRFSYDRNRAYPHTLDLKYQGARLFVDVARIGSLAKGIWATNTADRLRAAGTGPGRSAEDIAAEVEGFHLVQRFRIQQQLATKDYEAANRVDPASLNPLNRLMLKEALKQARKMQARLRQEYGL